MLGTLAMKRERLRREYTFQVVDWREPHRWLTYNAWHGRSQRLTLSPQYTPCGGWPLLDCDARMGRQPFAFQSRVEVLFFLMAAGVFASKKRFDIILDGKYRGPAAKEDDYPFPWQNYDPSGAAAEAGYQAVTWLREQWQRTRPALPEELLIGHR